MSAINVFPTFNQIQISLFISSDELIKRMKDVVTILQLFVNGNDRGVVYLKTVLHICLVKQHLV